MGVKKPYFLLEEPVALDNEMFNTLLGLVVENPLRPIYGSYSPRYPLKPRDAVDRLYPAEFKACTDFNEFQKTADNSEVGASLRGYVELSVGGKRTRQEKLSAASFRRILMADPSNTISELVMVPPGEDVSSNEPSDAKAFDEGTSANQGTIDQSSSTAAPLTNEQRASRAAYRQQAIDLFLMQQDRTLPLYVLTGFITCTGLTKKINLEQENSKKFSVGIGNGPYFDVNLGSSSDVGGSGTYEGECLLACSYRPLYLEHVQKKYEIPLLFGWSLVKAGTETKPEMMVGPEEAWNVGREDVEGNFCPTVAGNDSDGDEELVGDDEEPAGDDGEHPGPDFVILGQ